LQSSVSSADFASRKEGASAQLVLTQAKNLGAAQLEKETDPGEPHDRVQAEKLKLQL